MQCVAVLAESAPVEEAVVAETAEVTGDKGKTESLDKGTYNL